MRCIDGGPADRALVPVNPNERIAQFDAWLKSADPLPAGISYEWAGDTEEQEESGAFLIQVPSLGGAGADVRDPAGAVQLVSTTPVLVLVAVILSTVTGVAGRACW